MSEITELFDWAEQEGLSMAQLADRLGYSERHLYRIRAGEYPVTPAFRARAIVALGEVGRSLFLPPVSVETDDAADSAAT